MSLTVITGFAAFATARVGANGGSVGDPEAIVGTAAGEAAGQRTWDANLADGLDSGWVAVTFTALAAGGTNGVTLSVAGCTPSTVAYSQGSATTIGSVIVRAAVDGAGRKLSFRNIVVKFYLSATGTAFQTIRVSAGSAPVADTAGLADPVDAEATTQVDASREDYQKVVVTAEVRLQDVSNELAPQDAIVGDIYLFP